MLCDMGPTSRGGAVARLLLASVDAELDTSGAAFAMSVMQQPSFETVQSRCTSASLEVLHLRRGRSELSDVGARASDGPCQAASLRSAPYRDDAAVGANLIRPDSSHSRQHRIEASSEFCRRFPASDAGALRRALVSLAHNSRTARTSANVGRNVSRSILAPCSWRCRTVT